MPLLANKWTVDSARSAMRDDVFNGLSTMPKSVPSKWLYDSLGIDLFDQISKLPEYYVTRAETEILQNRSMQIAAETGADTLVDLGSGAFTKTRLLLNALGDRLAPEIRSSWHLMWTISRCPRASLLFGVNIRNWKSSQFVAIF